MKAFVAVVVAVALVAVYAADEKKPADGERPKTFRRLIPADVLRGEPLPNSVTAHGARAPFSPHCLRASVPRRDGA